MERGERGLSQDPGFAVDVSVCGALWDLRDKGEPPGGQRDLLPGLHARGPEPRVPKGDGRR